MLDSGPVRELRFTVPGPPRPKERPRLGKGGHTNTPDRTSGSESRVRLCAQAAASAIRWKPRAGDRYAVTLVVVVQDRRRRDMDNLAKGVLDAMNGGLAYRDDSDVDELHVFRRVDPAAPRVEVAVSVLSDEAPAPSPPATSRPPARPSLARATSRG